MRRLGDRVAWVCTINEANTPLHLNYNGLLDVSAADQAWASLVVAAAAAFGVADSDLGPFLTAVDDTPASA